MRVTTSLDTANRTGAEDLEIDPEDTQFRDIERPWDPESIRVATNSFSLRNMIDLIADGSLDLAPDFQRLQVWDRVQRAQLIESILLQNTTSGVLLCRRRRRDATGRRWSPTTFDRE